MDITPLYGTIWALFPPIVAILLALLTKEVYSSLFIGILTGALMSANFSFTGTMDTIVNEGLISSVSGTAGIFVFLVILGILVALVNKTGASASFGRWAEKNIKTKAMRDEESIAMLDILFDSKFYELGGWGTKIYENIGNLVMKGENTYSSTLEKTEKTTQNEFKELPNAYRN